MSENITRRDWLVGGAALAGSALAANLASAQSSPEININPTPDNAIRCGYNENVYGPSLKAKKAILDAYNEGHLYNFQTQATLRGIIAKMENLPVDHIAVENGSSPFLDKAAYVTAVQGGSMLLPTPTYTPITWTARAMGAGVVEVPVGEDMAISLDNLRGAMNDDIKLIYICNPNNPVPNIIEKNALKDFCIEMSKRAIVFIDEAYFEYAEGPDYATMAELVQEHRNIIVTRTASKIHAFASLRIGFAFAHPDTLRLIMGPINLSMNHMSMMGAIASYQDTEYQTYIKKQNATSMKMVDDMCEDLGLEYIKSRTNFAFFNAGRPSTEVEEKMKKRGVLTGREFAPYTNWVRLSTAKPEEMKYVVEAYKAEFG